MISFDASKEYHKSKIGAVAAGTSLRFRLCLPRSMGVRGVNLILIEDGCSDRYIGFDWESTDGVTEWWTKEISFDSVGVFFYCFSYSVSWGTTFLKRRENSQISSVNGKNFWQQTVFDPKAKSPESIKNGIIYQIFPDRFCCSGEKKENVPSDRILRTDCENLPVYLPDEKGYILNNDYFCGDFKGIEAKLDYIKSLGVGCIYLNPVCEAHSNHRYDTADYLKPDPLLGTEEDFKSLVREASKRKIEIILDGVFSHTGADSVYFNKNGRYNSLGAYQSEQSEYRSWYTFGKNNEDYACWWNIKILPEVNELDPSFKEFITGKNGVIKHWLDLGAGGFRFDVADELPDGFIDSAREIIKGENEENYFLGEVWEDATNKISHGGRRKFLLGGEFDGVMNYPFRRAIIDFLLTANAESFMEEVYSVVLNYPPYAMNACMNMLSTHDTPRILTLLAGVNTERLSREQQAHIVISENQAQRAERLLGCALAMLYTLPGIPCVYYGDEAGMYGGKDPFNRCFYPWGRENGKILDLYSFFGKMRAEHPVLKEGGFYPLSAEKGCVAYLRYAPGTSRVALIVNNNPHEISYRLNWDMREMQCLNGCERTDDSVIIPETGYALLSE